MTRTASLLSLIVLILVAVAAAGDLFVPGLLRDNAWTVNAIRGQDLYTLVVALPAMAIALIPFRRGSLRAALVVAGILGYLFYTYVGAAMAFAFNEFLLLYIALYTLSAAALVAVINTLDLKALPQRFTPVTPRRAVAVYLLVIGFMLCLMELAQIIPFITTGKPPLILELAGGPTFYPYALDLGMVVPLSVLAAVWLWRGHGWGYLLSGCMLIKAATMGMALLVTNLYAWLVGGTPDPAELLAVYGLIGFGGLFMSVWFLRHVRA